MMDKEIEETMNSELLDSLEQPKTIAEKIL